MTTEVRQPRCGRYLPLRHAAAASPSPPVPHWSKDTSLGTHLTGDSAKSNIPSVTFRGGDTEHWGQVTEHHLVSQIPFCIPGPGLPAQPWDQAAPAPQQPSAPPGGSGTFPRRRVSAARR